MEEQLRSIGKIWGQDVAAAAREIGAGHIEQVARYLELRLAMIREPSRYTHGYWENMNACSEVSVYLGGRCANAEIQRFYTATERKVRELEALKREWHDQHKEATQC